ncbi:hypothetical protein BDF22DRAFT_143371 [Syncephalis plumigaleata]|nr:hypothetical protein BDF22DRAFT_143371 [Syncephalis plumigaleata]
MPIIDYDNPAHTEWVKNASYFLGIPLHPFGEINVLDYYAQDSSLARQPSKLLGSRLQISFGVLLTYILVYNTLRSVKMVIKRPRTIASWCCFLPCSTGVITALMFLALHLGYSFNCRHLTWALVMGVSVANICNCLLLLQKAYLVLDRKRWILYASAPFILMQASYGLVTIATTFTMFSPELGCTIYYQYFMVWYWFAPTFSINLLYSAIFCRIAFKQYQRNKSDAWKRLTREGIQIMCLAALCNITCCIIVKSTSTKYNLNFNVLYIADWVLINTILIRYCQHAYQRRAKLLELP